MPKTKVDKPWISNEITLLKKLYPKTPLIPSLLASFPNRTRDSIAGKARALGLKRGPIGKQDPFDIPDTTAAYFAGLIDCDGSVSLLSSHRRSNINLRPAIAVYNTDTRLLRWIAHAISIEDHISRHRLTQTNHKPIYEWKIQSVATVAKTLPVIMPYLVIKKEQAILLLEWCENRVPYTKYTKRELQIRENILKLNKRGPT